jgi:hypothetical protein
MASSIRLKSGLEIRDPEGTILEFARQWYPFYDGVPVPMDNELRVVEIALSAMLMSRISGVTGAEIWRQKQPVEDGLSEVPVGVDLLDIEAGRPIPGMGGMEKALDAMCAIHRCKLAVATKILHKKRPGLISIFDSRVEGEYKSLVPRSCHPSRAGYGKYYAAMTPLVHEDMLNAREQLERLRERLQRNGTPMTPCRIFNALTWKTLDTLERQRRARA